MTPPPPGGRDAKRITRFLTNDGGCLPLVGSVRFPTIDDGRDANAMACARHISGSRLHIQQQPVVYSLVASVGPHRRQVRAPSGVHGWGGPDGLLRHGPLWHTESWLLRVPVLTPAFP
jgi:hypothetical protein